MEIRIRSLHPKQWSLQPIADELRRELDSVATACVGRLRLTTLTWRHRPTFRIRRQVWASTARVDITPEEDEDSQIFVMVDQGTAPHSIQPKSPVSRTNPNRPSALATRAGYRAKSTPRSLRSQAGGHVGATIYKPGVWHPGIEPRYFMVTLRDWAQIELERRVPQAVERGLARGIRQ